MVHPTYLVVSLFIVVPLLGIVNGFTISSRDPKFSAPSLSPPPPSLMSGSTETPGGIETKTSQLPHHVPLDIVSSDRSKRRAISLVKREVNPEDEERDNGLSYDPNLMMSKRSAAALNKMLLSFPSFYEPSNRHNNNDYDQDRPIKERNYNEPSALNLDRDMYFQSAPERRGQKDSRKFRKCFFNAVSCF